MSDYILNPYQGNILPGTTSGANLYLAANKGIDAKSKRLPVSLNNVLETKEHCMKVSHMYVCKVLANVPHTYVADGTAS